METDLKFALITVAVVMTVLLSFGIVSVTA
ncbi:YnhF family membrane protein [Photobacterium proteolyticum]|nr:YnhF family membrane protein [Photobacterium proteolyticum]